MCMRTSSVLSVARTHFLLILLVTAMVLVAAVVTATVEGVHTRQERSLIYHSSPVLQLTIGVQVPVPLPRRTIAVAVGLQANFILPTNVTQLNPYYALALANAGAGRGRRAAEEEEEDEAGLGAVYASMEQQVGRPCVLRAVCEAAAAPLDPHEEPPLTPPRTHPPGLFDEILHLILTPSEAGARGRAGAALERYLSAERRGRRVGDCEVAYPACPASPLDALTRNVPW